MKLHPITRALVQLLVAAVSLVAAIMAAASTTFALQAGVEWYSGLTLRAIAAVLLLCVALIFAALSWGSTLEASKP